MDNKVDFREPYNVILTQGNGNLSIEFDGAICAIEIIYKGDCSIHNNIESQMALLRNPNKIIMFMYKKGNQINSGTELFKYLGTFKLISCNVYNFKSKKPIKSTIVKDLDYWNLMNSNWESISKTYDNCNRTKTNKSKMLRKENNKFERILNTKRKIKNNGGTY